MGNMWTIAKREYKYYFASPLAYVVALVIFLLVGGYFALYIWYASQPMTSMAPTYEPFAWFLGFMFVFTLPPVTMRSISEETRSGTMELLLTAPVRDWELVVGKWLGAFLFILTIIAVTWIYPLILNSISDPGIDQGALIANYLGITLLAASFLAIGIMFSSIFSSQVLTVIVTLLVLIIAWFLLGIMGQVFPTNTLIPYLDIRNHFETNFMSGVINLTDVVYFLSVTALTLFLGSVFVEIRRWR